MKKDKKKVKERFTDKEELFLIEYFKSFNKTRAYYAAGYTAKNDNVAGVCAFKLLRKPKMQARVEAYKAERYEELKYDEAYVIDVFKEIIDRGLQRKRVMVKVGSNIVQKVDVVKDPETNEEVLAQMWEYDPLAVVRAAENLAKIRTKYKDSMFTEKVEHSGSIDVNDPSKMTDEELRERIERVKKAIPHLTEK